MTHGEFSRRAVLLAATSLIAARTTAANAQDWPSRPVKVLVGFAAGGNISKLAQLTCERLSDVFAHRFIVENRPGATGTLAGETAAKAEPDGYTFFWGGTGTISIYPAMASVPYELFKDIVPVAMIATSPQVLVVNPEVPVKTADEFVTYVKARQNQMTYAGGGGPGSVSNLLMALFLTRNGMQMQGVSYRGTGPALADLIGGHVQTMFAPLPEAIPQAQSGNIRMLAIADEKRSKQAPDVPTLAEAGFSNMRGVSWNGMFAPAKTAKSIIDRIGAEFIKADADPNFMAQLDKYGANPVARDADQFAKFLQDDIAFWKEAVSIAGLKQSVN